MPDQVINYKCPACTGPLHFGTQSGKLECDYCGSSYTLEEIEAMQSQKTQDAEIAFEEAENAPQEQWDLSQAGSQWGEEEEKLRAYSCPQCGAELIWEVLTRPEEDLERQGREARRFVLEERNNVVQAEKILRMLRITERT